MEVFRINIIPKFESPEHAAKLAKVRECAHCATPLKFHYKVNYELYIVDEQFECPRCQTLSKVETHPVH